MASTGAFALAAVIFCAGPAPGPIVLPAALLWGLTFGGAATGLQTDCADATGLDAGIAQSMIVTVWNAVIAAGGGAGGVLLDLFGPAAFAPAVLALAIVAFAIAFKASGHAFPRGPRKA